MQAGASKCKQLQAGASGRKICSRGPSSCCWVWGNFVFVTLAHGREDRDSCFRPTMFAHIRARTRLEWASFLCRSFCARSPFFCTESSVCARLTFAEVHEPPRSKVPHVVFFIISLAPEHVEKSADLHQWPQRLSTKFT